MCYEHLLTMQQRNAELRLKGASLGDIQGPPRLLDLPSNASLFHSKRRYLRTSQAYYWLPSATPHRKRWFWTHLVEQSGSSLCFLLAGSLINAVTDQYESNTVRFLPPDSQFMKYFFLQRYAYLCHANYSGSRAHDRTKPERHPKNKASLPPAHFWLALSVRRSCCCLLRMHRKSIHVVNISRRLKLYHSYLLQEHCWTLKGSYHQCSYARLVCRRQHPRHADFPTEASTRLYLGKNQHHRDSFGCVWLLFWCSCTMIIWIRRMNAH